MKTRITNLSVSLALFLSLFLMLPSSAQAATTLPWRTGCVSREMINGVSEDIATLQGIECIVENILGIAVSGIGIASFVMLIIGSFLYLTSGGNPKTTDEGQKTITFAIAGIVVALSGWIIINFIGIFAGPKVATQIQEFSITLPDGKN
jgi:orotate phosphoribosyltransferase-like protein